jgi:hypothetical protein
MAEEKNKAPTISWAVPKELGIPPDTLRLRIDFFHQATELTYFQGDTTIKKMVDAMDIAHALARELNFNTGLLPENTLWWVNSREGQIFAIYVEPKVRRLALQTDLDKPVQRFNIPLPGFIFLCSPGKAPWVVACTSRPTKETDIIYHSPLLNIYRNGRSCGGSQKYTERPLDIIHSFFISFFTAEGDTQDRSKKYPKSVIQLWKFLDGKEKYPIEDLIPFGMVSDLMKFGSRGDDV